MLDDLNQLGPELHTWPIYSAGRMALADVCATLGLPGNGLDANDRATIEGFLSDPAHALAVLERLPVACLVLLEATVEHAGAITREDAMTVLERRTSLDPEMLDDVVAMLAMHGLVTVTETFDAELDGAWVLLAASAMPWCVELVRGLTLPVIARPPEPEPEPREGAYALLALAGLTAHRTLKMTKTRGIEARSLRRFAEGIAPPALAGAIVEAAASRLVIGTDASRRLVPQVDRLLDAARGAPPPMPPTLLDWFMSELVPDEWVPLEAVARAFAREQCLRPVAQQAYRVMEAFFGSELFELGWASDTKVVRRRAEDAREERLFGDGSARVAAGDAIEVHLGREASDLSIAWISLGAELVHWDPGFTFRMTEKTISNARALGVEVEGIVCALEHVGDEALAPEIVERVRAWYRGAAPEPIEAASVSIALEGEAARYLSARLEGRSALENPSLYPLGCEAAPSLRKRYDAARAEGFESDVRALSGQAGELFGNPPMVDMLEEACAEKQSVRLHLRSTGERVWVRPIRVHDQGLAAYALTAIETETELGRMIDLDDVASVRPGPPAG